jgi:hypothetical protein
MVTASPNLPLAALSTLEVMVRYEVFELAGTQTINVSFQPDCGPPASVAFTSIFTEA